MPELEKQTWEKFQIAHAYFRRQREKNLRLWDPDPGDPETRKAAMPYHLRAVVRQRREQGLEFGVGITVAEEGFPFRVSTGREGPMATWAVRMYHLDDASPSVIFCDAETGEVGEYRPKNGGWGSEYTYPEDQSFTLCIAENIIADTLEEPRVFRQEGVLEGFLLAQTVSLEPASEAA